MFNIKDLLQLTRYQKIVISFLLIFTTVLLTAYLVYLFVKDLNSPLVTVVFPAVQYLWIVLSVWGGVLLIGQGDSSRRITSLTDEFLEKIFPESFGILRFLQTNESEAKDIIKDVLFTSAGNSKTACPKWTYELNHHKGSPFAFYKFLVIEDENKRRPVIRLFVHINQRKATLIFYNCLKDGQEMEGSNTKMALLTKEFAKMEESFGYIGSFGQSSAHNINIYTLNLTTDLADNFLNSAKLKLAFSHDAAMMTNSLLHHIESAPKLSKDLMTTMNERTTDRVIS